MAEAFCRDHCPKCGKANMVNLGDMDDLSAPDLDGIECYLCGNKWLFEGVLEIRELCSDSPNNPDCWYTKVGKPA